MLSAARGSSAVGAFGPPAANAVVYAASAVDSDDEEAAEGGVRLGAVGKASCEGGDSLRYQGERIDLEPGDGAWVPVRRERRAGTTEENKAEVVLQALGGPTDVAPGLWATGQAKG